jgi:hypothetical protein
MLIERTQNDRLHLVGPIIFFFIGLFFNGLGVSTLMAPRARKAGSGLYLLINGIISQFVLFLLLARIIYLVFARQMATNSVINQILCKALPYLMTVFGNVSMWLMAFVTVERALAVTCPTRFRLLRSPRFAMVLSVTTLLALFGFLYSYIIEYQLIIHPDYSYAYCAREIPLNRKIFFQYTSLAHQIIPFLINFIAGITVIINIGRSKAASHHTPTGITIVKQARQRADLLVGPFICFISALPQQIILFLDRCTYEQSTWFIYLTLAIYYISLTPQIILFFIYLLPSPLYKQILFTETIVGRRLGRRKHIGIAHL